MVKHEVLYGECLSGALYWNDFLHLARKVGTLSSFNPSSLSFLGIKNVHKKGLRILD